MENQSARAAAARRERGQSLAEFAIMLPVLLILLMGVLDLGRAFFTYLALQDAAAEGAYFGTSYPRCRTSADCANPNNIEYRVRQSAPYGGMVNWSAATVTSNVPSRTPGDSLTVSVSYDFTLLTPVIQAVAGSQTLRLTARSIAVIVGDNPPP